MRKIEPHQPRRGLGGIAHQVVVIGPDDGDEQIAYSVAEPGRPERQKRLEGRDLRRPQFQNEHGYQNGEHTVGERAQPLGAPSCK